MDDLTPALLAEYETDRAELGLDAMGVSFQDWLAAVSMLIELTPPAGTVLS